MFFDTVLCADEVFRSFTYVNVLIPHCKDIQLQVKVLYYWQDVLKVSKLKVLTVE